MYYNHEVLYISLNIYIIEYLPISVCLHSLSSTHTPTCKLVRVWALDKLVHTNDIVK